MPRTRAAPSRVGLRQGHNGSQQPFGVRPGLARATGVRPPGHNCGRPHCPLEPSQRTSTPLPTRPERTSEELAAPPAPMVTRAALTTILPDT